MNKFFIRQLSALDEIQARYELHNSKFITVPFVTEWAPLDAESLGMAAEKLGHKLEKLNLKAAQAIADTQYSCKVTFVKEEDGVYEFKY